MATFITTRVKQLGLKMIDAKCDLEINVTPSDVKSGKRKDPGNCGFAKACKKMSTDIKNVFVFRSTAYVEYDKKIVRYILPVAMQKEVVAFDRGKAMEPGEYRMKASQKSLRISEIKKRSLKHPGRHSEGNGKTKRKIVRHHTSGIRASGHSLEY